MPASSSVWGSALGFRYFCEPSVEVSGLQSQGWESPSISSVPSGRGRGHHKNGSSSPTKNAEGLNQWSSNFSRSHPPLPLSTPHPRGREWGCWEGEGDMDKGKGTKAGATPGVQVWGQELGPQRGWVLLLPCRAPLNIPLHPRRGDAPHSLGTTGLSPFY